MLFLVYLNLVRTLDQPVHYSFTFMNELFVVDLLCSPTGWLLALFDCLWHQSDYSLLQFVNLRVHSHARGII